MPEKRKSHKENKKSVNSAEVMRKPRQITQMMSSEATDPNGSYTGVPENPNEKPVQDADDL